MKKTLLLILLCLVLLLPAACRKAPERVTVQHVLIAFQETIPKPEVTRTQAEAETLAVNIFDRARAGEDFDSLVRQYTDDEYPGIYSMSNFEVTPAPASSEYPRNRMVKAFGDVSFGLRVNEVGLAVYDPETSKYGWHIIKRLK